MLLLNCYVIGHFPYLDYKFPDVSLIWYWLPGWELSHWLKTWLRHALADDVYFSSRRVNICYDILATDFCLSTRLFACLDFNIMIFGCSWTIRGWLTSRFTLKLTWVIYKHFIVNFYVSNYNWVIGVDKCLHWQTAVSSVCVYLITISRV